MARIKQKDMKYLASSLIVLIAVILLCIFFDPYYRKTPDISLYPCDIYFSDDWCDPYVDWGYANGALMASRILDEYQWEQEQYGPNEENMQSCEKIVQDLYDQYLDQAQHEKFPTRVK